MRRLLSDELDHLEPAWPKDLPDGLIHADAFPDNVLFVGNQVGGVIDLAVPPIRLDTRSRVERAANGFLTPLVSNPMLNCLNFLARHPAEARSMGKVGHSFALTQHSDKRLQAEIERLYFDLLGSAHLAKRRELRRPNKQSA